jgi:hypothetical protein
VEYQAARLFLIALCALAACGGADAKGPDVTLFAYDASRPLGVQLGTETSCGGVARQELTFDAGNGARLPAIYTHPTGGGRGPSSSSRRGSAATRTTSFRTPTRSSAEGSRRSLSASQSRS